MKKLTSRNELDTMNFPLPYQDFLKEEEDLTKSFVYGVPTLLDVGSGEGRIIGSVAPLVGDYTGIDIDPYRLDLARQYLVRHSNARLFQVDAREISKHFGQKKFTRSISLFNTIGCVQEPARVLQSVGDVTKDLFLFTVMAKGAVEIRENYYTSLGIPYTIDPKSETIYSDIWGESRSYSSRELEFLCEEASLQIKEYGPLTSLAYFVIAKRNRE